LRIPKSFTGREHRLQPLRDGVLGHRATHPLIEFPNAYVERVEHLEQQIDLQPADCRQTA
jgi:hypothetical protein